MRALTIHQPYAELILRGLKRVENRTWATKLREPILIHAGQSRSWLDLNEKGTVDIHGIAVAEMTFSAILGVATIVDCVKVDRYVSDRVGGKVPVFRKADLKLYPWLDDHEHAQGPYCFILADVVRFAEPIPCGGKQGFWTYRGELPPEVNQHAPTCGSADHG